MCGTQHGLALAWHLQACIVSLSKGPSTDHLGMDDICNFGSRCTVVPQVGRGRQTIGKVHDYLI